MKRILALYRSSVGKKALMAATGLLLFGFIVSHMLGNLKVFQGPEKFSAYAEFLRTVGYPLFARGQLLWLARIGLIVAVIVHVVAAVELTMMARDARPTSYGRPVHLEDTYASRTMRWGGVILAGFVIYHVLHFTFGTVHPNFEPGDPYGNVITGFQSVIVAISYIVVMGVLGLHLYHGIWSALQTLGITSSELDRPIRTAAGTIAVVIFLGFIAVPVAVWSGVLR